MLGLLILISYYRLHAGKLFHFGILRNEMDARVHIHAMEGNKRPKEGETLEKQIFLFVLAMGAIILLVACAVQSEAERLLTILLRGLLGAVGIHFANFILAGFGISTGIGINVFTFLTTAFLGTRSDFIISRENFTKMKFFDFSSCKKSGSTL